MRLTFLLCSVFGFAHAFGQLSPDRSSFELKGNVYSVEELTHKDDTTVDWLLTGLGPSVFYFDKNGQLSQKVQLEGPGEVYREYSYEGLSDSVSVVYLKTANAETKSVDQVTFLSRETKTTYIWCRLDTLPKLLNKSNIEENSGVVTIDSFIDGGLVGSSTSYEIGDGHLILNSRRDYVYNKLKKPVKITFTQLDTNANYVMTNHYDNLGRIVKSVKIRAKSNVTTTSYRYNNRGYMIEKKITSKYSNRENTSVLSYVYDAKGNWIVEKEKDEDYRPSLVKRTITYYE